MPKLTNAQKAALQRAEKLHTEVCLLLCAVRTGDIPDVETNYDINEALQTKLSDDLRTYRNDLGYIIRMLNGE